MTVTRTYLDHNATSPLRLEARQAMLAMLDSGGNASSVHEEGRRARAAIEDARDTLATAFGCKRDMITFTSGGTEANNIALKGAAVDRFVISSIEHPCVVEAARATGKSVTVLPVSQDGVVDLKALDTLLVGSDETCLVSVMLANNETGVIEPVAKVAEIAARHGALVHCDAVQAVGKIPVRWPILGVDLLTVSAHKFGGPQGIGALLAREDLELSPLIHGGGQELRRRPGTENLAAICGLGAAMAIAVQLDGKTKALRDRLEKALRSAAPEVVIFAGNVERLPNTCCFAIPGMTADTTLIAADLDGIAVSSGSACSSGKVGSSSVLAAMGVDPNLTRCAIRVSLGWNSTAEDVDRFIEVWEKLIIRHRKRAAA